jgi:hypothetical protein
MGLLKMVLVKITVFMLIKRASVLKQYIVDCVSAGTGTTLYANPAILTAFYTTMTNAATAIQEAIDVWTASPTKGNKSAIKDAMDAGKVILKSYASQVQVIANLPINAVTRDQAYTNILQSHLTPQKVGITKKIKPVTPQISAKNTGTGTVDAKIINTHPYATPNITFFFAISKAPVTSPVTPEAVVSITEGQLKITAAYAYQFLMLTIDNKGKVVTFKTLTPAQDYSIYSISKNGDKFISDLSDPYDVKG